MAFVLVAVALVVGLDRIPLVARWGPPRLTRPALIRVGPNRLGSLGRTNAEARFLAGIASELRAGASLRGAFEAAAERAPELQLERLVRLSLAGVPISALAAGVSDLLLQNGRAAAAAMRIAGETGGKTAAMFEGLAQVAAEDRALYRELRAATAQAKISSLIVGGMPVGFLVWQALTGRLFQLASSGIGITILVIGLTLLVGGAAVVGLLLRGAVR